MSHMCSSTLVVPANLGMVINSFATSNWSLLGNKHAVELLIGCGPESLTHDVFGGRRRNRTHRFGASQFSRLVADHSARAFRKFVRDGEIRTHGASLGAAVSQPTASLRSTKRLTAWWSKS